MKAIVRILKNSAGSTGRELDYILDPDAKNKRKHIDDLFLDENERIGQVFGIGMNSSIMSLINDISTKDDAVKLLLDDLEQRPKHFAQKGKNARHVVISVEPGTIKDGDDVKDALKRSASDFVNTFAPGSKAIVVRHDDSRCPHVHLLIESFDCKLLKAGDLPKRLDWDKQVCSEMQGFEWSKALDSGRGYKGGHKGARSNRGSKIAYIKAKRESEDIKFMNWLYNEFTTFPSSKEDVVKVLEKKNILYKVNRKNGLPLRFPVLVNKFSGKMIRISRFQKHCKMLEYKKNKKNKKNKDVKK